MSEAIKLRVVDRTGWPAGPWDAEGDDERWRDPATGLPCIALRNHFGAWCGYVGVGPGHPDHGRGYDDVDVVAHGGLTFASPCDPGLGVCHAPGPGEPDDLWWLGFDCGHWMDAMPSMAVTLGEGEYRDLGYAKGECASLARQLAGRVSA